MARTYQPTLIFLAQAILAFVARYRTQIDRNLTEPQKALLTTLTDAATALLAALESNAPI